MLGDLTKFLPIPTSPFDVDESVLMSNQRTLGIWFPDDYVAFSRIYGSGIISTNSYSWKVWSAACPSFPARAKDFHDIFAEMRAALETFYLPLGLFPEPEGLLPFEKCDNGVWWCWKTSGTPNDWTIVDLYAYDDHGFQVYDMGFEEFLVDVLTGKLVLEGTTFDWDPQTDITFSPQPYRFSPP